MPPRAILAIERPKSDTIVQWSKAFNVKAFDVKAFIVRAFNVKKMYVELELPAAGENFDNLRFFIEFGALFQQCGKKTGVGRVPPRNYGLANARPHEILKTRIIGHIRLTMEFDVIQIVQNLAQVSKWMSHVKHT